MAPKTDRIVMASLARTASGGTIFGATFFWNPHLELDAAMVAHDQSPTEYLWAGELLIRNAHPHKPGLGSIVAGNACSDSFSRRYHLDIQSFALYRERLPIPLAIGSHLEPFQPEQPHLDARALLAGKEGQRIVGHFLKAWDQRNETTDPSHEQLLSNAHASRAIGLMMSSLLDVFPNEQRNWNAFQTLLRQRNDPQRPLTLRQQKTLANDLAALIALYRSTIHGFPAYELFQLS
ncbi:MAG: hypothetical protein HY540_01935 [Deltaproteobacteria bacterium]|nr:hypothetical protein [Deltaproteobacteria bacterium]